MGIDIELTSLLSALGVISAVSLGWLGRASVEKKEIGQRVGSDSAMRLIYVI